jgi:hypothetical protein
MDGLTIPEIHNWYNNIVKRFGWIALSTNHNEKKKNYKDEIKELIDKIENKLTIISDNDNINDLKTIIYKLNELCNILDKIKGGNNRRKKN